MQNLRLSLHKPICPKATHPTTCFPLLLKYLASFTTCSLVALRCTRSILLKIAWPMSRYAETVRKGNYLYFSSFSIVSPKLSILNKFILTIRIKITK